MQKNPGMVLVITFVLLSLVNGVVIYFANRFFPNNIVLGTMSMNNWWAIFHSATALALINTFALPFTRLMEQKLGRMLSIKELLIKYLIVNFLGIWLITRFSDQFGLGISNWYIALVLAAIVDFFQGGVCMMIEKGKS